MQDYVKTNLQHVHTMPKLMQNMAMLKVYEPIQTHIVLNDEQESFSNLLIKLASGRIFIRMVE